MNATSQTLKAVPAATTEPPAGTTHQEIRAASFVLVDGTGRQRAELKTIQDESVLSMHDAQGLLRLTLRAGPRAVTLNIFGDQEYKNRPTEAIDLLSIGWEMGDQTPFVRVYDRDEENEVTTVRNLAAQEDDEDEDEADSDEADDDGKSMATDFRALCDDLAEALISVTSHERCPAYASRLLLDAITEISNHQDETEDEEAEFVRRACRKLAN